MNQQYPVVEQRNLAPVPERRRVFGPKQTRTVAEIPQGNANHRLVYRIDGDYLLDNSALRLDSPEVLAASHVSMVEVSRDVEVLVQLDIPSKDADSFTLLVTFVCGVTDPVAVVREGTHAVEPALRAYLKGHHRIFELGLDYRLSEVNDVRRKLNNQVKAYTTIDPPLLLGLTAELASVEVTTPEELAKVNQSIRDEEHQYAIDAKRQTNRHELQNDETKYEQFAAVRTQRHEFDLDATRRQYERYQYQEQVDSVATDPRSALTYAYSVGQLTAKEFVEQMIDLTQTETEAARADATQKREWEREDAREQRDWERDTSRRKWDAEREDKAQDWQLRHQRVEIERDERRQLKAWEREDQAYAREDERRRLEGNIEIIKELAQRGHLDTANVNLERVVNTMLDRPEQPDKTPTGELAPAGHPGEDDRAPDVEVREEDAH